MQVQIISATQTVVSHLRDRIITADLAPGLRLNETLLASALGVSRPPLREALRILEAERLVVSVPRKSTYVTEASQKDFEEISEARLMIEGYSIDLLQKKEVKDFSLLDAALSEASMAGIKSIIDDPMEILRYLRVFADFHVKLVVLTGNSHLIHYHQSILNSLCRYQFAYFSKRSSQMLLDEHRFILDYLKAGDYGQAKQALLTNICYSFESLTK
jgi:DNA-binding GntR family transcriptional regulator